MRCLLDLDKVTARHTAQGLLKLAENESPTTEELAALDLFSRAAPQNLELFIVPPTANVLQRLATRDEFSEIVSWLIS